MPEGKIEKEREEGVRECESVRVGAENEDEVLIECATMCCRIYVADSLQSSLSCQRATTINCK